MVYSDFFDEQAESGDEWLDSEPDSRYFIA
jgi:hypothetical protein